MTHYQLTRPLSDLPPSIPKSFKLTTPIKIDFVRQFNALCVGYILHNHTGGTATYRINDESDTIDLKSLEENLINIQISEIELVSVTNADLVVMLQPLTVLKRYNAIEVG